MNYPYFPRPPSADILATGNHTRQSSRQPSGHPPKSSGGHNPRAVQDDIALGETTTQEKPTYGKKTSKAVTSSGLFGDIIQDGGINHNFNS